MKSHLLSFFIILWLSCECYTQPLTNVGTDFWIAFPPNENNSASLKFYVTSDFSTSGTVTSAFPGINQSFTVAPGVVTELTIPSEAALVAGIEDKGIHIISNDPITLCGFNAAPSGVFYLDTRWSFEDFGTLFWSSTTTGPGRVLAHGLNTNNFSVSSYPASRANAFPARCLKD